MPHDAISRALERRIPAGIRAPSLAVIRAIDLDYEALRGRQEVRDEAPEQWHLPAKEHAEPPPAEMVPHELLGCGERAAHRASQRDRESAALWPGAHRWQVASQRSSFVPCPRCAMACDQVASVSLACHATVLLVPRLSEEIRGIAFR